MLSITIISLKVLTFIAGFLLYSMFIHGIISKFGFAQTKWPAPVYFIFFMSIIFSWTYIGIRIIWPGIL